MGGFFPVGVGEVRGEAFPVRPQGGGRVGQNGPVFPALEAGVFQQTRQKGIVVQDGADDEDVRVAVADLNLYSRSVTVSPTSLSPSASVSDTSSMRNASLMSLPEMMSRTGSPESCQLFSMARTLSGSFPSKKGE